MTKRDQRSSENALSFRALNHLQKNWLQRCALLINKINWLGELEQTMPAFQIFPDYEAGRFSSYLHFPVIYGGFIKFFAQLEGDLRILERTFSSDGNLIPVSTNNDSWLCWSCKVLDCNTHSCRNEWEENSMRRGNNMAS